MKHGFFAIVCVVVLAGCSSPVTQTNNVDGSTTTTVKGANGETATATTKGDSTTYSDSKGTKATIGSEKVPDLSVEIMPGLEMQKGSNIETSTEAEKAGLAVFTTAEPVAKIEEFYKGKLGADAKVVTMNQGDTQVSSITKEEGKKTITVTASKAKEDPKTSVTIAFNEKLK